MKESKLMPNWIKDKMSAIMEGEVCEDGTSCNLKKFVLDKPETFRYQMLSRFQMDADYFFGNGAQNPGVLWAGDPVEHANNMIAVWNSFPEDAKPKWMTKEELDEYVEKLKTAKAEAA